MSRARRLATTLAAVAVATVGLTAPAAHAAKATKNTDARLRADLRHLAAGAGGSGGFAVLDGKTGRVIAEDRPTTARPLGSTAKLLTTGAALRILGPRAQLPTTVWLFNGLVVGTGTLIGDVFLKGGGDPLLDEAQLRQLADKVVAAGVRDVSGSIVGDESLFDTARGGPATNGAFDLELTGSLGALTYARGRQAPNGPLQPDPARAAAFRFDDLLEERGVVIHGTPRAGTVPPGSAEIARVQTPLTTVVKTIDKQSDDFAAEVLAKGLGAARSRTGTTAAGVAAIKANIYGAKLRPVDGSGVDRDTKGSPRELARLVRRLRTVPALAAALPIAGVDGTLQTRMTAGPARRNCRAKTGSLPQTRVSALAGWCRVRGRTLVFALLRERVSSQAVAKATEDAMVQRIAASRKR